MGNERIVRAIACNGDKELNEVTVITVAGVVAGALSGVVSGAIGTGIMQASSHTEYAVMEAVKMGALGGSILVGSASLIGELSVIGTPFGFFSSKRAASVSVSAIILSCFLSGLIGYAILHEGVHVVAMELKETAISFAIGAAVLGGTALLAFCCGVMMCPRCFEFENDYNDYLDRRQPPNYGAI